MEERKLIEWLLSSSSRGKSMSVASNTQVTDMQDGAMGSIRFVRSQKRRFGAEIARGEYKDSDGILVSITFNSDEKGEPFELDFWKVDFSKLKSYPRPEDVILTSQ